MIESYGFTVTAIKCSGCAFDGKGPGSTAELHPDLTMIHSGPGKIAGVVLALHREYPDPCAGGKLRIEYCQVMAIPVEEK